MSSPREFAWRLKLLAAQFDDAVEREVRAAGVAAATEAIFRTPVLTGRARSNWTVCRSGAIVTTVIAGLGNKNRAANASIATLKALMNVSGRIKTWNRAMGSLFITNCVPYIFDLDKGTSSQARQGMTKFAIMAAKARLRKARLLSNGGD